MLKGDTPLPDKAMLMGTFPDTGMRLISMPLVPSTPELPTPSGASASTGSFESSSRASQSSGPNPLGLKQSLRISESRVTQ